MPLILSMTMERQVYDVFHHRPLALCTGAHAVLSRSSGPQWIPTNGENYATYGQV